MSALVVVPVVLAGLLIVSAAMKLSHRPDVVERYARVGVREEQLNPLAAILILGALGLIAGIYYAPIGIAAAVGLVAYFAMAIGAHLRAGDRQGLATPIVIELLSVAALGLWIARLLALMAVGETRH